MNTRLIGLSLLLGASACASTNRVSTYDQRKMLAPQNGPRAHVYAAYSGGLTYRNVRATFRTDKDANVIVGRLGGDGRVEILYPETPKAPGVVKGGKTYTVEPFHGDYDGIPQLYNYASWRPRSFGAQLDSYDGRGNGFLFVIATEFPMFTEVLDDHGQWSDSLVADDYYSSSDPRYSIRSLAEVLTRGMPYSLDYADAFTTQSFTGGADRAMDCMMLQSYGYYGYSGVAPCGGCGGWSPSTEFGWFGGFFPIGGYSPFMGFGATFGQYSPFAGCGFAYDRRYLNAAAYRYGYYTNTWYYSWWAPSTTSPRIAGAFNPNGPVSPTASPLFPSSPAKTLGFSTAAHRPGAGAGSNSGFGVSLNNPRPDRSKSNTGTSSGSTWAPPIRPTHASEGTSRASRPNWGGNSSGSSWNGSGSSGGNSGGSHTEVSRPSAPAPAPAAAAAPQPAPPPKVAATADNPRKP